MLSKNTKKLKCMINMIFLEILNYSIEKIYANKGKLIKKYYYYYNNHMLYKGISIL